MMRKIEKRCSTCEHWIRVSMPADVGMCLPTTGVTTGESCCEKYETDHTLKPKRSRKRGVNDGKADNGAESDRRSDPTDQQKDQSDR